MKKFITTAPRQWVFPRSNNQEILPYESDNPILSCPIRTPFPVIPLIDAYIADGDSLFEVIVITAVGTEQGNCAEDNYRLLVEAVQKLAESKNASCRFEKLEIPLEESSDTHLDTFAKIIELIQPEDTVYCDITYGTKTTPIIEMLALNFAYQCKDASVECVSYGEAVFDRDTHEIIRKKIYDITPLFLMDQIVNTLARGHVVNPLAAIQSVLSFKKAMDEDTWEE